MYYCRKRERENIRLTIDPANPADPLAPCGPCPPFSPLAPF